MKPWLLSLIFTAPLLQAATQFLAAGILVDSQTHRPIANAHMYLAPTTQRMRPIEFVTKQDGRFSFSVENPGKYRVQMYKVGYARQAYRQSEFASLSSAIVIRDDQDTGHIVFEAKRGAAIVGVLKNENFEPVGDAFVTVFQSMVTGGERTIIMRERTRSNAAGEFRFYNLPRGNYYVCATGSPWFANSVLALQHEQEQLRNLPRRPNFVVEGSPRPDVRADDDPGQAPPNLRQYSPDPNFRGTAYPLTFYPAAQAFDDASAVHLETGGQGQIAITLPFTQAVSLKGSIVIPGQPNAGEASLYKKIADQYVLLQNGPVTPDGKFQFQNVPSGSYEIAAASNFSSGPSSWYVRQQIDVGSTDTEVSLSPDYLGALSGRVLVEGDRPANSSAFLVSVRDERGRLGRVQTDPDGKYSFRRLPMGRYEISVASKEYVAAYLAGSDGERLPLQLEISSGEPIHRDLTLTRAVSMIEGVAEKDGKPQVGAFVLLMPKDPSQRWAYRADQSDSDGSFGLTTIPSGDYYLIALSDRSGIEYRKMNVAAILAKFAKAVHLNSGDRLKQTIEVVDSAALHLR